MIFDVDGVLTDGGLLFTAEGDTMKCFNSLDGHGMKLLRQAGMRRRSSPGASRASSRRGRRNCTSRIVYQGVQDKTVRRSPTCCSKPA